MLHNFSTIAKGLSSWMSRLMDGVKFLSMRLCMSAVTMIMNKGSLSIIYFTLFLFASGGSGPSFVSTVGSRVPLKTQFLITLVGCPLNTWNVRTVSTLYALQYPGGKQHLQDLVGFLDGTSTMIASLLQIDQDYILPERYPCQMCMAFVYMFLVGGVALCIQWWKEFVDREKFLQKALDDASCFEKSLLVEESFLLHSGFGIDNFLDCRWMVVLGVMTFCCIFFISWRCIVTLFHITDGIWFEEVWTGGIS